MICHSSLAVPSSSTLTPSSYSLNIITGEYRIIPINIKIKQFCLFDNCYVSKYQNPQMQTNGIKVTPNWSKAKLKKKHQNFTKMLSCRTFEIGSTINITTSFCRVIYWDRVGTLWWKPMHIRRIHIKGFNSQPLVWVRPFLCGKWTHFRKKVGP